MYLGQVRPSSAVSCPSCWKTGKIFFYHCLHARCRIGNQVLYSAVLIGLTLHGRHVFTTAGVRLKQKFSFSNFCPSRGLNPGPRSLMTVNVTTRLWRHPIILLNITCSLSPIK